MHWTKALPCINVVPTHEASLVSPYIVSLPRHIQVDVYSLPRRIQVWSDFSHPQCINQCSCPSLASLQWIANAFRMSVCINQCSCPSLAFLQWIANAFWMSVFSVSFSVFSMFFYAFCKAAGSQTFSDRVPFVGNMLSTRTTLFQERSMCQI